MKPLNKILTLILIFNLLTATENSVSINSKLSHIGKKFEKIESILSEAEIGVIHILINTLNHDIDSLVNKKSPKDMKYERYKKELAQYSKLLSVYQLTCSPTGKGLITSQDTFESDQVNYRNRKSQLEHEIRKYNKSRIQKIQKYIQDYENEIEEYIKKTLKKA